MPQKKLGFGLMRLPLTDPEDASSVDLDTMKEMVDTFLARGFTYFDTAWMYCGGTSESAVRKALVERYPRDSFTLTTKLPAYLLKTKEDRDRVFQEQLQRTGAGFFDYYFLHDVNTQSLPIFEAMDCFTWLRQKQEQGLIKTIGFSFHDGPALLNRILTEHSEIQVVQLQINYLDWENTVIQSRACYETAVTHGKPVLVMEPVKGGTLAHVPEEVTALFQAQNPDWSTASWAIRFAASLEHVKVVLSGMSNLEQVLDNTSYMAQFQPLTQEELKVVYQAVHRMNQTIAIPCTGCSYCTVNCPAQIAIPKLFSLYNADLQERKEKDWTIQCSYYENLISETGKPESCVDCGQCERMCPQHLSIRSHLRTVSAYFAAQE